MSGRSRSNVGAVHEPPPRIGPHALRAAHPHRARQLLSLQTLASVLSVLALLLLPRPAEAAGHDGLAHALSVTLHPGTHRIEVIDRVALPDAAKAPLLLRLHAGLDPRLLDTPGRLERLDTAGPAGAVPTERLRVELAPGARHFTLSYGGILHHPVESLSPEYARSFSVSPGIVGAEGVFLSGASAWVPEIHDLPVRDFTLDVHLPPGWHSVSQGARTAVEASAGATRETWHSDTPQEEVLLIAAPFVEYRSPGPIAEAQVYLRHADAALAQRYLEATQRYLALYSRLLGQYPYPKFALVENFWETGYGMPSFTLLGPQVIRFPFILRSSYPHEILHNWWGNGVFVDYASGNWSEGLTSYLADHLLKEQDGEGAEYRRSALQRYADFVRGQADFPLSDFRGRHDTVTEAVGYGKGLMVFHMLRRLLGDAVFVDALRDFYRTHLFQVATWQDLEASFEKAGRRDLGSFFAQWVQRTGAPALRLREVRAQPQGNGFRLTAQLDQVQEGPAYDLQVPVAVHLQGQATAYQTTVPMPARHLRLDLTLAARPLRLEVDAEFDLFRRLARGETPPSIGQAYAAEAVTIVLPRSAPPALRAACEAQARAWQRAHAGTQVTWDDALDGLPAERTVWLFGWDNRHRSAMTQALQGHAFGRDEAGANIAGNRVARKTGALVVVAPQHAAPDQVLVWLATDAVETLPSLARKLPHYAKYSYLVFDAARATNLLKGQWPVIDSPLSQPVVQADGSTPPDNGAAPAPRTPLASLPSQGADAGRNEHDPKPAAPRLAPRGPG